MAKLMLLSKFLFFFFKAQFVCRYKHTMFPHGVIVNCTWISSTK